MPSYTTGRTLTTKTISGVDLPRRCPSATTRLATDGKLCASEIYGVANNVNDTARVTTKTISGVDLPRRCPSATTRLATDGKLCASEIYGVANNVNDTARVTHIFLAVNVLESIGEDEQFL
ncbi:hypothetical protein DY000_02017608 [Brassica cretica]|uniref:Uncharacterized protein n=1 Tax=Brassica cretica TaxID=69181 RepID=A0ABQ7CRA3_BRACR|nr:hypothetical protein DY000_02017608 [Brassica cretica]